ncbi:MAG: fused MFS/spermidine synthase [Phycisphaerae bacterium]
MRRTLGLVGAVTATVAVGLGLWVLGATSAAEETRVRYDRESRYYRIRVVDYPDEGRRCLHFSKSRGIQSSMKLSDPTALDLRYSKSIMAGLALHPDPKDVLLVGLGGASIPKFVTKHWPDIRMDILEIDPGVVEVCQEYFAFDGGPGIRVIVMDGRMYLKRSRKQYDLIMLDAYAADHIPFHLTTVEFVRLVRDHLKPGGVVASNLWEYGINRFYHAELRTFQEVFPETYLFRAGTSGNVIVFGTTSGERVPKETWAARAERLAAGKDLGFDLPALVRDEFGVLTDRTIEEAVLTDDKAPVGTLRHEHPKTYGE